MAYWFGAADAQTQKERDEEIRHGFGGDVERATRGELDGWAATPGGRLALILLLDQFSRNIYRGTARAFAGDARALALVRDGMRSGAYESLSSLQRLFFYMPLQHAEDPAVQEESVRRIAALARDAPAPVQPMLESCVPYAIAHRDIVRRFGRFPHRNAILGRASTPEESAYLAADAPDFGQPAQR